MTSQWADFHEIHAWSTMFCKELLYGILWKPIKLFTRRHYVTDGR